MEGGGGIQKVVFYRVYLAENCVLCLQAASSPRQVNKKHFFFLPTRSFTAISSAKKASRCTAGALLKVLYLPDIRLVSNCSAKIGRRQDKTPRPHEKPDRKRRTAWHWIIGTMSQRSSLNMTVLSTLYFVEKKGKEEHIPADCGSLKGGWSAQRQLICVVWASGSVKKALDTSAGKVGGRRGQQFLFLHF